MKTTPCLAMAAIAAMLLGTASAEARAINLQADIAGSNENPGTASAAFGHAVMLYDTETNTYDLTITLHNFTETLNASHVHNGFADQNGPVVNSIGPEAAYSRHKDNLTFKAKGVPYAGDPKSLLAGGNYVNFHTATYPGGAVRGQLIPNQIEFMAVANGLQEVPANGSAATGVILATYYPRENTIDLSITLADFPNTLLASHIHEAPAGVNGPIVVPLGNETTPYVRDGLYLEAELEDLVYDLAVGHPIELMKGNAYVNFHTPAYPGGEIRGQLQVVVPD